MNFDPQTRSFTLGGIRLGDLAPMIDGVVPAYRLQRADAAGIEWSLEDGSRFTLALAGDTFTLALSGFSGDRRLAAIGIRIGSAANVRQYLRNGYMSWDGSYFVEPEAAREVAKSDTALTHGYAATALLPQTGNGVVVLGFLRHDRYQSQFTFDFSEGPLALTVETLIDRKPMWGEITSEPITLFYDEGVEEGLRRWARAVASASPIPPRLPSRRLTGWCSWYNLYASLDEPVLREHLDAAARFRDEHQVPFDIFQIDDGFTPEMGDWLEFKPQFPSGIAPLLAEARTRGFTPGLWIAPFMVGNRSRLFAEHPDWVVHSRSEGMPLAPMKFYGEFRWHKRSEEYYVLDITHPDAANYMRQVFRTWAREWGCGYFKADFMHLGSTYGPDEAIWHEDGLSRMEIWMRMIRLMREEIGDALLLLCGSPIWAPIGYADAMRIGRDVGVSWEGHYSAQSLLRDQTARNFANNILWQADPDCILLRERYHELTEEQVLSLAQFAGLAGGIIMTSDNLDEVPAQRKALLASLLSQHQPLPCSFPELGSASLRYSLGTSHLGKPAAISSADPVFIQKSASEDGSMLVNVFNTGPQDVSRLVPWSYFEVAGLNMVDSESFGTEASTEGLFVSLNGYESRQFSL